MGQFPISDLQTTVQLSSAPNMSQFAQQQQQQKQTPHPQNTAAYQNQSFNVQTPQFNKNFMTSQGAPMQHYSVSSAMPGQFGNVQASSSQAISYPPGVNVNQGRLLQQTQSQAQQRGNFPPIPQGNPLMTQGMNLTTAQQPQQSIGKIC